MEKFSEVYKKLNDAQRQAVDTIYGPVLVIAGPGTGKTQLLSARVAHILQSTDTLPQNILCLTFTENGALNMRERLTRFIGPHAYDVQIGTYHSFGRTVIGRFPEYFSEARLERPIDELGKRQLLSAIIDEVDYRSPIKQVRHHLGDLVSTISEIKRGLLSPNDLRKIAKDNLQVIESTASEISTILAPFAARMPGKLAVAEPLYRQIQDVLLRVASLESRDSNKYNSLALVAADALGIALEEAVTLEKGQTTPLTKWKNKWLIKNKDNAFVLAGALESARIAALAGVLESYQAALLERGVFDFDDMILRAIEALEKNDDLRFTLQEQYQFILLDEFQDTNAAQLKLVELLTNNPVHEGRPNVLAVGDDDQAIYAFQGAQYSNMLDFYHLYRDTTVIALRENYRSGEPILQAATAIANQIEARLHRHMTDISKDLIPKASDLPEITLQRKEYTSDIAEYAGVASEIKSLIEHGVHPNAIAVLAPKHRYLEPLVPHLQSCDIPVSYEKRENILNAPVVKQILAISKLAIALQHSQHSVADSMWPEILSYEFWGFSVADIWNVSWQASDKRKSWTEILLSDNKFKHAAMLLLTLAGKVTTDSCETILDAIIGTTELRTHDADFPSVRSPLRDYYFKQQGDVVLFETISELNVLRAKLRDHQTGTGEILYLKDLLDFIAEYEMAEAAMLNTSPYNQANDAVQLMTVFKAKGLEWQHVFLLHCNDDVWGSKSSGMGNKLTLPSNLLHIRHAGATEDERLRLLFVAITRAKSGLYLSSYVSNFAGKKPERLKYFDEVTEADDTVVARNLPNGYQKIITDNVDVPSVETLALDWHSRHLDSVNTTLRDLLQERISRYQLSPTHLTHFIDLKYGGPESFLISTILKFPGSPSVDSSFGNAIHDSLEWVQNELNKTGSIPDIQTVVERAKNYLSLEPLTPEQITQQQRRAESALLVYLSQNNSQFVRGNIAEKSFKNEGVFIGEAHMSGKIDLLEVDKLNKTITVVDYKTGESHNSWKPETDKLHKYMIQLYCYKLLVENSVTYRGYKVTSGRLEFVEPNGDGNIHNLPLNFTDEQTDHVRKLLNSLWNRVQSLDMPDISMYGDSLSAMKHFENDLIT